MKINICIEGHKLSPQDIYEILQGFTPRSCEQLSELAVDEQMPCSDPEYTPFVSAFRSE